MTLNYQGSVGRPSHGACELPLKSSSPHLYVTFPLGFAADFNLVNMLEPSSWNNYHLTLQGGFHRKQKQQKYLEKNIFMEIKIGA